MDGGTWEEAETCPSHTQGSNGCQRMQWASGNLSISGQPPLGLSSQELLLGGAGRLRPSNLSSNLQICLVLGGLPALLDHGFQLASPAMLHVHATVFMEMMLQSCILTTFLF